MRPFATIPGIISGQTTLYFSNRPRSTRFENMQRYKSLCRNIINRRETQMEGMHELI